MNNALDTYYACSSPAQRNLILRTVYQRIGTYLANLDPKRSEVYPTKVNFWVRALLIAYLLGEYQKAMAWRYTARLYIADLHDYQGQNEQEAKLICHLVNALLEAGCAEECLDLIERAHYLTGGADSRLGLRVGTYEALVNYFLARQHLLTSGFSVREVCGRLRKAESDFEINSQVYARHFGPIEDASENRFHWLRVLIRLGSTKKAKKVYDLIVQHDKDARRRGWATLFIKQGVAGVEQYDRYAWPRLTA